MARKKILTFIDWFLPGYKAGGPIRSLANIVTSLNDRYEYYIVTANTDLDEQTPYDGVPADQWTEAYGAHVYYMSRGQFSRSKIKELIGERDYDLLYLNSMFSYRFMIVPWMVRKKYFPHLKTVLAPRGMLGEGALKFKPLKKKIYLGLTARTGFFKGLRWHATTDEEKDRIVRFFGNGNEIRIGQCLPVPEPMDISKKAVKQSGELKLFYIARVTEHKNLSFALEYFARHGVRGNVSLDIFGAKEEEEYWNKCNALINQLSGNIRATYHGPVPYDEVKMKILTTFHVLLLPTKGESYSHAILDAWGCGCPVLISNNTPWSDMENERRGWNYSINGHDEFGVALQKAIDMDDKTYREWARCCMEFYRDKLTDETIINNNLNVFA